ncbi:HAD hydrolase family protein [Fusicatenibacter sp.]
MKALFFDIDGTLLSEITREIPQSALNALKKQRKKEISPLLIPDEPGRSCPRS